MMALTCKKPPYSLPHWFWDVYHRSMIWIIIVKRGCKTRSACVGGLDDVVLPLGKRRPKTSLLFPFVSVCCYWKSCWWDSWWVGSHKVIVLETHNNVAYTVRTMMGQPAQKCSMGGSHWPTRSFFGKINIFLVNFIFFYFYFPIKYY